ncbi:MAG: NAD-dependent epimerase/dehydratase family protein [Candidatus Omnitrophica bacterium]|nr:NAD-dependent epimerase/dehydratase family protein [Candidatus Omnitrophota bacterium]
MSWKHRKVLVTGATGFIGSHLVERLVDLEAEVECWAASEKRLARLARVRDRIDLRMIDIRDLARVAEATRRCQPEIVYHLAAYGVNFDERDMQPAVDINIRGTVHLLEALKGMPIKRIIAAGTWAEYGPKDHPAQEEDPLEPVGTYGTTKATATTIAMKMAVQDNLPLVVLRPFSVYGPGEGDYKFVPIVIRACLKKTPPKLTSCRQVRDYVYIEDAVEAFIKAADARLETPIVLNIASGRPVQLKELVDAVVRHFPGIQPDFGAMPDRENEIWSIRADISKAKKLLGWEPTHTLEQGITQTISWFKNNPHGN